MTQPTRDELLKRLAEAQAEQESVTSALIWLELDGIRAGLDGTEAGAAARLRDAHEAMAAPLAQLAVIDEEIAAAGGKRAGWQVKTSVTDPDKRAVARIHFAEWDAEVTALRARRDQADAMMQPFRAEHDRCRKALEVTQAAKTRLLAAMLNPFGDPLAQATEAYVGLRQPHLNYVLLRGDRGDPEWEMAAVEHAELGRIIENPRYVPEVMARTPAAADPVPSGAEVMAMDKAAFENVALQQQPSRIDDYRKPGPPRAVAERPWMKLPGAR